MNLEQQVVSLKLSKELKKLGVKVDSLFSWVRYHSKDWEIEYRMPIYHKEELLEV